MQLRLDAADRLVELVEERRGAVPVEEAARALFALRTCRRGWRGRCSTTSCATTHGSPGAEAASPSRRRKRSAWRSRRRRSASSTSRRRGSRRAARGSARSARSRIEGLELADTFQTLVNPRERLPLADRRAHRHRRPRAAGARRARRSRRGASSRSPATPCSWRTTRASTSRSSTRRCCGSAADGSPRPSSTPCGSRAALLAGRQARVRARFARAVLRNGHAAVPSRAAGCRGDRGDPAAPDRSRAGARRAYGLRTSSSSRRRAAAASTESARSRSARRRCRASTSSATRTGRCCTSAARATFERDCARTSVPSGSVRRSRRRSRPWSRSSGASLGSELEAALEELRLLRELRPPANARSTRPDRYVYLACARRLASSSRRSRRRTGR